MIRSTTIKALVVLALTVIHARILSPPSPHHRLVDTQAMITAVLKTVHEQKFTAGDGLNGDQFEHAVNTTLLSVSNLIDKAKLESVACCARMNLALEGLAKSVSDDKSADRTTVKMLYDEIAMIRRGEMEIMGHFHLLESTGVAAKLKWKERKGISKAKQDFHNNFVEQTCEIIIQESPCHEVMPRG